MKSDKIWITSVIYLGLIIEHSLACSCLPAHPEEHYCTSDFAILARVKKQVIHNDMTVYKVQIKRHYKMSEKAYVALKSGRLHAPSDQSLCAPELKIGTLYVITGKVRALQAHINLCNFATPWEQLTKRQRKGFRRMYTHGCSCKIERCSGPYCKRNPNTCHWSWPSIDCHFNQGICMRQKSNNCRWNRNSELMQCLAKIKETRRVRLPSLDDQDKKSVR